MPGNWAAVFETIRAGLKNYAGAKEVVLADPRLMLAFTDEQLPLVVLTTVGGTEERGLPGNPHEFVQVPNPKYPDEEPWPFNVLVVYRTDHVVTLQVDVYGLANATLGSGLSAGDVAEKAIDWFKGAGREEWRAQKFWVQRVTAPTRAMGFGAPELEESSYERWWFEVTLVVPTVTVVSYGTVESVASNWRCEGAARLLERSFEVESKGEVR